jgi:outer membrane murein-binding lipoprotein Lpp
MINAGTRLRAVLLGTTIIIAGSTLSGCATEEYVDKHIATVNQRIDETDRRLSGRIDQSDAAAAAAMQRAEAANALAQSAGTAAQTAGADATRANEALAAMTPVVDHLEKHHRYRTWRNVAHRPEYPPKRKRSKKSK